MNSISRLTARSIHTSFSRYLALLLIVLLSVGFFVGLKVTDVQFTDTCQQYLNDHNFSDIRIMSASGLTDSDLEDVRDQDYVRQAQGTVHIDAMMTYAGSEDPYTLMSINDKVNTPSLTAGRMPEKESECLADAKAFSEKNIGSNLVVSDDNRSDTSAAIGQDSFKIVGLCNSPLYLGDSRGTASIGSGAPAGFIYVPAESLTSPVYTEIDVILSDTGPIYTEGYDSRLKKYSGRLSDMFEDQSVYVLTSNENSGYASFDNDTSIVTGIADIFPIFFIIIAMLVCITTMSRMVDEERTQIGTLKAMGYSSGAITMKYMLYAGSATLAGWAGGFFFGTRAFPLVLWKAYGSLYDFAPLNYVFSPSLALITLGVSMAGILVSTYISCRTELMSEPAALIRPKTIKNGRRILLERIRPLWSRLSFLQKITLRNMFRYRNRFIMMLVGISCCTALVVTAFGVRDSMIDTGSLQYGGVQKYQLEANFSPEAYAASSVAASGAYDQVSDVSSADGPAAIAESSALQAAASMSQTAMYKLSMPDADTVSEEIAARIDGMENVTGRLACSTSLVDVRADGGSMNTVHLYSFDDSSGLADFWDLHRGDRRVAFPDDGGAVVGTKIAEKLGLSVGDTMEISSADSEKMSVKISGIFDNYVDNFVLISAETCRDGFGSWQPNTYLLNVDGDIEKTAEDITAISRITGVSSLAETKDSVDSAVSCLNYIIWIIVLFSGALEFIVIFNLTNINIEERSREIATVEVLGFYPKETNSYVLRENLMASALAAFIGLPCGWAFHHAVMSRIVIDTMTFDIHVTALSYVLSVICTIVFALIVDVFMRRRIRGISMAESLKAVE